MREITIIGNVAHIPLTRGMVAIVDAEDFHLVDGRKWSAKVDGEHVYASSNGRDNRGQRKTLRLHRHILGVTSSGVEIDHIDGNGLNNRRENLRIVTKAQNQHNRKKSANNTSGFKGVFWHRAAGKWAAAIRLNGKRSHLGLYVRPEDAHAAYQSASERLHGEFGRVA